MARLTISFLGSLQISIDGKSIKTFKSNRTRALLAYLAVEGDRPHRRETLAGLLWPDWTNLEALNNLRSTLSNLRSAIGDREAEPAFLLITRDSLQLNPQADIWLDVAIFSKAVDAIKAGSPFSQALQKDIDCYQGNFLEGFSLGDSPEFEEWILLTREKLARDAADVFKILASYFETNGDYSQAQTYAWRWIELDPLDETAHQQLMRLLALSGQRSAALAQYESCADILAKELDIDPSEETTRLYEQIRADKLRAAKSIPVPTLGASVELPAFLREEHPRPENSVFVARERELTLLDQFLQRALNGQGQVVFVTGEAGSGKTSLIQEFCSHAQSSYPKLCVVSGNCNAYTGIGDPYLPFREILDLLTGKVEARLAAGAISQDHALQLWNMLPAAVQALVEEGADLLDTFLLREALLERAYTYTTGRPLWLQRLIELLDRKPASGVVASGLQQNDLFDQYTTVLQILARQKPMILVLDDLQWADVGSVSLLFHLGRRLLGNQILLVGAYRPEEISILKDGVRHPVEPVINEFRRLYGDLEVNLELAENREFVNSLLDSEPNHLGPFFRQMLSKQTGGHPLFTVELLRGMQERGDIIKDADDRWVEGRTLDWDTLPARVEAAIKERIDRLPDELQRALSVASVEGEVFTAEVVARIIGENERVMIEQISGELVRKHRLISPQAIERIGLRRISHYRFRSYLLQKYLYDSLDKAEKAYLHEDIGNILEEYYGDQAGEIAVQLARHFQEAGVSQKAITYLHQAGDRAMQLSAYQEAITHITKALDLLMAFPDSPERANQELNLQISLAKASLQYVPTPGWRNTLMKARQLCQQTGNMTHLYLILGDLSTYHYVQAEHQIARELAEEALQLSQQTGNPLDDALGHWYLGFISFALGEFASAKINLEYLVNFYRPEHHQEMIALRGSDMGLSAVAYYAGCLWCLGYPDQAEKKSQEALALAQEFNNAITSVEILCYAGCMFNSLSRNWQAVKKYAEKMIELSNEKGFIGWIFTAMLYRGNALAMLGNIQEGIAKTQEALDTNEPICLRLYLPGILHFHALAHAMAGDLEEGLNTIEQALEIQKQTTEGLWEADIYRVKAQLLLEKGDAANAEECLLKAIETARRQEAKSWELRASIDLCRLWHSQGKNEEARQLLSNIYNWFTEGFETADLKEAKKLLAVLS